MLTVLARTWIVSAKMRISRLLMLSVRRGRPVARIVPLRPVAQPADWSNAAGRLREAYPEPVGGIAAADLIADGRGQR